jgi:hypothetical protein
VSFCHHFSSDRPRNKNCLWRPCLLMDRDEMSSLYRGPSIDASYQVSVLTYGHAGQLPGSTTRIGSNANLCLLCIACFFNEREIDGIDGNLQKEVYLTLS